MPIIKECSFCKRSFASKAFQDRKFCSRECFNKESERKRTFSCTECQIIFVIPPGTIKKNNRPFCSKKCWGQFQIGENNPAWKGVKEEFICKQCKAPFMVGHTKRKETAKFCSIKCRTLFYEANGAPSNHNLYDSCHFCKAKIKISKGKLEKRNFCGRECASAEHSSYLRGEMNGRYVNGAYESEYAAGWTNGLKRKIREKCDLRCRICGHHQDDGSTLHIHHIDGTKNNHSPDNLIALCKYCHRKTHGVKVREEWKEKLSNL